MKNTGFRNRNGDLISFLYDAEGNTVEVRGHFGTTRRQMGEDGSLQVVDISGGPYFYVGRDISQFLNIPPKLVIESIDVEEGKIILKVNRK